MGTTQKQSMAEFVEQRRSTGYDGREMSIAQAPFHVGTCATAMRHLEIMATHIASAWLDGDMPEDEYWQFVRDCLLPNIVALSRIIEPTFASMAGPVEGGSSRVWEASREPRPLFYMAWAGADRLIRHISVADRGTVDSRDLVISFLVAVMILRQLSEREIGHDKEAGLFHCSSTNVAPEFFDRCIRVLGRRPFGATEGKPLTELEKRLEELANEEGSEALGVASQGIS